MKIYRYNTEPEAQKIKYLLEKQSIPCEIHSFENWGYDGALRGTMGMGEIIVPDDFADRAKGIIDKFVREEKIKTFTQDVELTILKLETNIKQNKIMIPVICTLFMILGSFLSLRLRGINAVLVISVFIGICIAGIIFLRRDIDNAKKKIKMLKAKSRGAV